jgi:hypothetical protein
VVTIAPASGGIVGVYPVAPGVVVGDGDRAEGVLLAGGGDRFLVGGSDKGLHTSNL